METSNNDVDTLREGIRFSNDCCLGLFLLMTFRFRLVMWVESVDK